MFCLTNFDDTSAMFAQVNASFWGELPKSDAHIIPFVLFVYFIFLQLFKLSYGRVLLSIVKLCNREHNCFIIGCVETWPQMRTKTCLMREHSCGNKDTVPLPCVWMCRQADMVLATFLPEQSCRQHRPSKMTCSCTSGSGSLDLQMNMY